MAFVIAGVYAAALAASTLQTVLPHSREVFDLLSVFYALLVTLMLGSSASAEERQMGTLSSQALLPIAMSTQWAVKVGVVIGLALLLGLGVPAVLVSAAPMTAVSQPSRAILVVSVAIAGLYVSSTCATAVSAMLLSLPTVFGAWGLVTFLRVQLAARLGRQFASLVDRSTPWRSR